MRLGVDRSELQCEGKHDRCGHTISSIRNTVRKNVILSYSRRVDSWPGRNQCKERTDEHIRRHVHDNI